MTDDYFKITWSISVSLLETQEERKGKEDENHPVNLITLEHPPPPPLPRLLLPSSSISDEEDTQQSIALIKPPSVQTLD